LAPFAIAGRADLYGVIGVIGGCSIARGKFVSAIRARRVGTNTGNTGNTGCKCPDSEALVLGGVVGLGDLEAHAVFDPAGIPHEVAAQAPVVEGTALLTG